MTAARQQRKLWTALAFVAGLGFYGILAPPASFAAAELRIEVNPFTGIAISGFDPVAYFTDHKPILGRADFELNLNGAHWRFTNPGNRAAFAENPDVYMPRFGGFDPVAIARGASVPGHPLIWTVVSQRLYLFYSSEARAEFLANPGAVIERATRRWPEVAQGVVH